MTKPETPPESWTIEEIAEHAESVDWGDAGHLMLPTGNLDDDTWDLCYEAYGDARPHLQKLFQAMDGAKRPFEGESAFDQVLRVVFHAGYCAALGLAGFTASLPPTSPQSET